MKLLLTTIAAVVLVGCGPSISIHKAAEEGNAQRPVVTFFVEVP